MATIFGLTQGQLFLVVLAAFILFMWTKGKGGSEAFDMAMQQTLTGSKLPASINVGGDQLASLEIVSETQPLPFYDQRFTDTWAEVEVHHLDDNGPGVATGQPMPVTVINMPKVPTYRVNLPPMSAPMTIPATSATNAPGTTSAVTQEGSNSAITAPAPPGPLGSYNLVRGVDWPGNDIQCEIYGHNGVADYSACQASCMRSPKCIGFVDVKKGTNPVFPDGFCCSKHTMIDPMSSPGVDSYHKLTLNPM